MNECFRLFNDLREIGEGEAELEIRFNPTEDGYAVDIVAVHTRDFTLEETACFDEALVRTEAFEPLSEEASPLSGVVFYPVAFRLLPQPQ